MSDVDDEIAAAARTSAYATSVLARASRALMYALALRRTSSKRIEQGA
jgi:hypothetical protein